jgi:hypothetical protein
MANNPLKKYFRQPKVYIDLPSKGMYNQPGTLNSDPTKMPVFGMTGMDELLFKTPDALLNGEATAKVIESCCPSITNGWDLSLLDLELVLTAIRIATHGNTMTVGHTCSSCSAVSDYDIDLSNIVQHYASCVYDNTVVMKNFSIKIAPLNYKTWTELQMKNFVIQRQLTQAVAMTDEKEQVKHMTSLFDQVSQVQKEMMLAQVEAVVTQEGTVDQREFIREFLDNSDAAVFDIIRAQVEKNKQAWQIPKIAVNCVECNASNEIVLEMDQVAFFGIA